MNSSNVAKYKVGLEVAGKTPSGEKCWVVRVEGSSMDGRSGPGVIELWVPGNDIAVVDPDEEPLPYADEQESSAPVGMGGVSDTDSLLAEAERLLSF